MGIYFKHYSDRNFGLVIFHGQICNRELDDHMSEILRDQYNQAGKRGLTILCENTRTSQLHYQAIYSAGKRMQQADFRQQGKLAIVAKSKVTFGLAKIFQVATSLADKDEIRVVRHNDLRSAIEWLEASDLQQEIMDSIASFEIIGAAAIDAT